MGSLNSAVVLPDPLRRFGFGTQQENTFFLIESGNHTLWQEQGVCLTLRSLLCPSPSEMVPPSLFLLCLSPSELTLPIFFRFRTILTQAVHHLISIFYHALSDGHGIIELFQLRCSAPGSSSRQTILPLLPSAPPCLQMVPRPGWSTSAC